MIDISLTPRLRALVERQFPGAIFESGTCQGRTRARNGKSTPCAGLYAHARYCKGGKPWCRMMLPHESPIGTMHEIVGMGKDQRAAFADAVKRRSRRQASFSGGAA